MRKTICERLTRGFSLRVIAAMREDLTHGPAKTSKSRINPMRELKLPQYRLRVDGIRVYYDVGEDYVMIHGIIPNGDTYDWLDKQGIPNDHSTTEPG